MQENACNCLQYNFLFVPKSPNNEAAKVFPWGHDLEFSKEKSFVTLRKSLGAWSSEEDVFSIMEIVADLLFLLEISIQTLEE